MEQKRKFDTKQIAMIGITAALVFAAMNFSFPIPIGALKTRIHLGNVMVLLSGFLLGGVRGGLAAAIGSTMFDVFYPGYISSAPTTLVFRFAMAYVCGTIANRKNYSALNLVNNIVAAVTASLLYVILYMGKSYVGAVFFTLLTPQAAIIATLQKGLVSLINALIGGSIAIPISIVLKKTLMRQNSI